jgi:hypothetical protein
MGFFRGPVHRRGDGTYAVELRPEERQLLGTLSEQLRVLLTTDSPVLHRLFPPPYGDDHERNEGWAALAHPELIEHRIEALDALDASLSAESLDEDQLDAWMRSINDVRLVLGTVLDVTDDAGPTDVDEDSVATYQAYEYLGFLLERIVAARPV